MHPQVITNTNITILINGNRANIAKQWHISQRIILYGLNF